VTPPGNPWPRTVEVSTDPREDDDGRLTRIVKRIERPAAPMNYPIKHAIPNVKGANYGRIRNWTDPSQRSMRCRAARSHTPGAVSTQSVCRPSIGACIHAADGLYGDVRQQGKPMHDGAAPPTLFGSTIARAWVLLLLKRHRRCWSYISWDSVGLRDCSILRWSYDNRPVVPV